MCGIVGYVFNKYVSNAPKLARELLIIDTLRGDHSTGVLFVKGDNYEWHKKAVPGWDFVDTKVFDRLNSTNVDVFIGHNRYATMGAIDSTNAHPFEVEDIIGVHNGSLRTGWKSYLGSGFDVDSEAIYQSMWEEGVQKTIERLEGAFSLVWWDGKDVNFCRNEERPMNIAIVEGGFVFGSDQTMIRLAIDRSGMKIKEMFSTKVGAHYKVDPYTLQIEKSSYTLKKPLPTACHTSGGGWYSGGKNYTMGKSHGGTPSDTKKKSTLAVVKGKVKNDYHNKDIVAYAIEYLPYSQFSKSGKLVLIDGEGTTFAAYQVAEEDADMMIDGQASSLVHTNGYITNDKDVKQDDGPTYICNIKERIHEEASEDSKCTMCAKELSSEDYEHMVTLAGGVVCGECCEHFGWYNPNAKTKSVLEA